MENRIKALSEEAVKLLISNKMTVSFCESCTGGSLAKAITDIAGSSAVFGFGAVTYANEAKEKMVGVSHESLEKYGAVSPVVAAEMAEGVQRLSGSDIAISMTGIAGPGGGSKEKPVGLVYMGIAAFGKTETKRLDLNGTREEIRAAAVAEGLREVIRAAERAMHN